MTALRAADVVQMDLAHCGGISAGKKIAAMAQAQDMRVAPHCSIGPVALAACSSLRREHAQLHDPGSLRRVRRPLAKRPGRRLEPDQAAASSSLGDAPGLGLELDEPRSPIIPMSPTRFPSLWDGELANEFHPESMTRRTVAIPVFRVALTGDFLNEAGSVAYGDAGLGLLSGRRDIRWHFISDLAPRRDDPDYWSRLYSLEVGPSTSRTSTG